MRFVNIYFLQKDIFFNFYKKFFPFPDSLDRIRTVENNFELLQRKEKDLLRSIVQAKRIARTELQKTSKLKVATFYNTVDSLYKYGLIKKSESPSHEKKGRPSEYLSLNEDCYSILYILLSRSRWIIGISDLEGNLFYPEEHPFNAQLTAEDFIAGCVSYFERKSESFPIAFVAFVSGINYRNTNTSGIDKSFLDTDFTDRLREAFGLPFFHDSISRAAALGIYNERFSQEKESLLFCNLSNGIGIAMTDDLISEDFWYRSRANIEHWTLDPNGRQCFCGKKGCLLTSLGSRQIVANAHELIDSGLESALTGDFSLSELINQANSGDNVAKKALDEAVSAFSRALDNLNMIFHFDVVTIAGTTIENNFYFITKLQTQLSSAPFRIEIETNHISKASMGMSFKILLNILS